jgi:hypothetical protein
MRYRSNQREKHSRRNFASAFSSNTRKAMVVSAASCRCCNASFQVPIARRSKRRWFHALDTKRCARCSAAASVNSFHARNVLCNDRCARRNVIWWIVTSHRSTVLWWSSSFVGPEGGGKRCTAATTSEGSAPVTREAVSCGGREREGRFTVTPVALTGRTCFGRTVVLVSLTKTEFRLEVLECCWDVTTDGRGRRRCCCCWCCIWPLASCA